MSLLAHEKILATLNSTYNRPGGLFNKKHLNPEV